MSIRVGIVGVSGYGGGEALRLCAAHPTFEVAYVAGEGSAGSKLVEKFPGIPSRLANLVIEKWEPEKLPELDVLFASLPSGQSSEALARVLDGREGRRHRRRPPVPRRVGRTGWPTYGRTKIRGASRVANPGCYPSAALAALAPLAAAGIIRPTSPVIVDAKSGVSGAGRGGGATFGFADVNEDVAAYALTQHAHTMEMNATLATLGVGSSARVAFTPHLIPMTRGILATCYVDADVSAEECFKVARDFYRRPAVRAGDGPAAAHEVGHGVEPGVRQLRRPRRRAGGGPGRDRQPRQRGRRAGRAEREPDDRPAGDGGVGRGVFVAVRGPVAGSRIMSNIPVTRARPNDGRPNRGGGAVGVGIAAVGSVLFTAGGSDALATIALALFATGLVVAVYHFTDARPGGGGGGRQTNWPPAALPFCPFCGRAARGRGRFCPTCGNRR